MNKSQRSFVHHLSKAPLSQDVPTLRSARRSKWKCLHKLCCDMMEGKLPRETKRWFTGVHMGRHKDIDTFKR